MDSLDRTWVSEGRTVPMRIAASVLLLLLSLSASEAAVLCARQRGDGSFNTYVKIREVCRPNEIRLGVAQLDPLVVGPQPPTTTTTSSTTVTSTSSTISPTTTYPPCGGVGNRCGACAGLCGQHGGGGIYCVDPGTCTLASCTSDADCANGKHCILAGGGLPQSCCDTCF